MYAKFEAYRPRESGTVDWFSGPKVVHYDRVVWTTMPDGATASAALQAGEQDWWEQATADLLGMLRRNRAITTTVLDRSGTVGMMRPNHLQPPFDNPAIRRAVLRAVDQASEMQAIVGDDPASYNVPVGYFTPGSPMASDAGLAQAGLLVPSGGRDEAAIDREIKAAGYAGEPVTLLVPTDYLTMKLIGEVFADTLRRVGMTVDLVATDWATMLQRRTNKGPRDKGGWNGFITTWTGSDWLNPGDAHLDPRQRRGGLSRLVHQRPDGGAAHGVVRGAGPGGTAGHLPRDAAAMHAGCAVFPAGPVRAVDGVPRHHGGAAGVRHVLERPAGLMHAKRPTVYLAGPMVFEPAPERVFDDMRAVCARHGLLGVSPLDNQVGLARGRALGMVMRLPERDSYSYHRDKMFANLSVSMGGRVAEELIFGHDKCRAVRRATSAMRPTSPRTWSRSGACRTSSGRSSTARTRRRCSSATR